MDTQDIIRQHGKSVAAVFKRRGITADVTPNNLLLHTILKGDSFIQELGDQVELDNMYTGDNGDYITQTLVNGFKQNIRLSETVKPTFTAPKTLGGVTVTAKEKSNKLKNTLTDILGLVGTGLGAFAGARAASKTPSLATQPYVTPTGDIIYPDPPEKKKKPNWVMIGGIALVVILAVALIFSNKK